MLQELIKNIASDAKAASPALACASAEQKNNALIFAAQEIENNIPQILAANQIDLQNKNVP